MTMIRAQIFIYLLFYFICVGILPACISVHHMCARCLWRPEEAVGSPRTGFGDDFDLHVGAGTQNSNMGPLADLPVL